MREVWALGVPRSIACHDDMRALLNLLVGGGPGGEAHHAARDVEWDAEGGLWVMNAQATVGIIGVITEAKSIGTDLVGAKQRMLHRWDPQCLVEH